MLLLASTLAGAMSGRAEEPHHCSGGVAMGNAVADGRAIVWRNMDWSPSRAWWLDVRKPGSGYETLMSGGQGAGVNQRGLCYIYTSMSQMSPGYTEAGALPIHYLMDHCATVAEVRQAIIEQINWVRSAGSNGVDHWVADGGVPAGSLHVCDAYGNATVFELGRGEYYEYDPQNTNRLLQIPIQVAARANDPPQKRADHCETGGVGGNRYSDATNNLLQMATNGDPVTIREMIDRVSRFGHPGFDNPIRNCHDTTQNGQIFWGARADEDPRTATFFSAAANPDYSPYVPLWYLGIQNLSVRHRDTWTNGLSCLGTNLFSKRGADSTYDDYINSFYVGMEDNFIEGVTLTRQYWLQQKALGLPGFDTNTAKRVSDGAADAAWRTMTVMCKGSGRNLHVPPTLTSISITTTGDNSFTMDCAASASALDGSTISSVSWDFGDGATASGTPAPHTYGTNGTFLVQCVVTDSLGAQNIKWKLVTAPVVAAYRHGAFIMFD